jgi:hypothetical protein
MPETAPQWTREPTEHEVRELAGAIYGTIIVTALVGGFSEDEAIDAWQLLIAVAATTFVFWVAHAYAEVLSKRLIAGPLAWREIRLALVAEASIIRAGIPAAIALALAAIGVYSTDTGAEIAVALGVVTLGMLGFVLVRQEGGSRLQAVRGAVLNASFGLVIVALKAFVG